jgi:D-arabinose 5-phosphate isomerase GutQ
MKSVLTAQDLHDEPQETGLKPVLKRNHWKQRQVNTVSVQSSASSAKPKLSVVTVKLPKKKKTNSIQSLPSPLTNKTARTLNYRQYTIS